MAEIVRRRSWGGVLPLGRHASISGPSLSQCASVSIALSSFQEGQNARHHNRFRREQALEPGKQFEIPTGQFAYLLTKEKVHIPHDTMAFISMRTGFKNSGL